MLRVASYESDTEMSEVPWALTRSSTKNSKADMRRNVNPHYRVDELNEPPPRIPGIRSLLPLPGGDLLTGGTDLKIRRWDHYRFVANSLLLSWFIKTVIQLSVFMYCSPDRSYSICGPNLKGVGNDDFYGIRSSFGVQVVQVSFLETLKLGGLVVLYWRVWTVSTCNVYMLKFWFGVEKVSVHLFVLPL